ncbi:Synergin gamma [Frankliniella fusca]|uniref:Synergin gamma n=1 Tax=Frankliniella fusca TaxID=407009 RepID=A0AAE1LSN8_9NEOP|nr:Synergin gamma [Frankliniella fusca]
MFPQQGSGMNRTIHPPPTIPSSSIQGVPGMPSSTMMSTGVPPTGYGLQHGFMGNIPMAPVTSGPVNVQPNQNKMWQQNQQQTFKPQDVQNQQLLQQTQQKDLKHRDYLKQQQRLKAMPLSSSKGMSADALIGNLLDKKDTFTPKLNSQGQVKQATDRPELLGQQMRQSVPPVHPNQPNSSISRGAVASIGSNDLPGWLIPTSARLPPIYSHIWSLVSDPGSGGTLVDTNKILALLLTSSLPKEVLGFIWNLATNGANVQLNQQQLYITLALVALAQMGCTFNNLSVLNFIPTPPIPTFNMNVPKSSIDEKQKRSDLNLKPSVPAAALPPPASTSTMIPTPITTPAPAPLYVSNQNQSADDDFDDFTDFQSADTSAVGISIPNVCNSLPVPATAVIQPSMTAKQVVNELNHSVVNKLGCSQGRSIGSRLANHTLGAPKSNQKHRRASVDSDNIYIQDDFGIGFEKNQNQLKDYRGSEKQEDFTESEDFSDFQVAAGLNVNVDELFPKCHPKPKSQDLFLKESAIRNESDDEDLNKEKEVELLDFDSSSSAKQSPVEVKGAKTIEIPLVAPPPSQPTKELMSIEEDKYSALRLIELEGSGNTSSQASGDVAKRDNTDDFGDFISADDLFEEIAVRDKGNSVKQPKSLTDGNQEVPSAVNVEFAIDDWGPSVFQSRQASQNSVDSIQNLFEVAPTVESKNKFENLSTAFAGLEVSKESGGDPHTKSDSSPAWSFDLELGKESSGLNLISNFNDGHSSTNDDDFGDFVGPDSMQIEDSNCKPPPGFLVDQLWSDNTSNKMMPGTLSDNRSVSSLELPGVTMSRHGSLPSLDLNLFPTTDDLTDKAMNSEVADWLRCLESSCSLLQASASTFTNITSHSVLLEVLGTAEGRNFLNNLLEVHRVTWRIQRSYQRSGQESNQVDSVLGSIQKVWSTLQTFYKLANIETAVEKDGSDEESGQPACGVCGSPASRSVLEYGGHVYHAPCANLWLNCVDRTLPSHSPLL